MLVVWTILLGCILLVAGLDCTLSPLGDGQDDTDQVWMPLTSHAGHILMMDFRLKMLLHDVVREEPLL
jgi:hypothetical protein